MTYDNRVETGNRYMVRTDRSDRQLFYKSPETGDTRSFWRKTENRADDTGEGGAERRQNIEVLEGASLYYRPCPVIPFKGSRFDGWTQVCLAADSEFAYRDILAGGRVGMGECFLFSHYRNRVWVTVEGKPVWMDHCLLEPENMSLENLVFFDGFTHQGTFYYYGPKEKQEQLFNYRPENKEIRYGVSGAVKGIGIRILAGCAQGIERIFEEIEEKIGLRNE